MNIHGITKIQLDKLATLNILHQVDASIGHLMVLLTNWQLETFQQTFFLTKTFFIKKQNELKWNQDAKRIRIGAETI